MKNLKSILLLTALLTLAASSCKDNKEIDVNLWNDLTECAKQRDAYIAACDKDAAAALDEMKRCQSACILNTLPCFSGTPQQNSSCMGQAINNWTLCRSSCEINYYRKMAEISACKQNWEAVFWKCVESKYK